MNKILVIGSLSHEETDNIEWTQPFCDIEKYDSLIIDLTSFPKDYPQTLFTNIGILKRTSRLFIRDSKEIFCIMEKPFKILFKEIPLNYSWIPFPQKLTVNPMLLGKTIHSTTERFADYIENVEKWDSELFWQTTDNCSFETIAVNKANNPIAATVTMGNRGKIHFLPKPTKISPSKAIKLLTELVNKEEKEEYPWLHTIENPEHEQLTKYRNLFSVDAKKITKAVYLILEDLGITTAHTPEFDITRLKGSVSVQIITVKGKVEAKNAEVNKVARFIEKQRKKGKIIVVANTYKDLPIKNRANKEHIDSAMKLFFETNNTPFLTTLSLYNLYKKVIKDEISVHEAASLIQNQSGEIQI
ncbi:MAG: hypothetical protein CW691_07120 [Candidatus Bathyarchaeum sp.]|nr:MAG: hypothetical protein CW691_07120 [Candidatus Bathyarchaeum sp.]